MGDATARAETSAQPEDLFAGLFAEVFGLEQARLLVPQPPAADIEGATRYVDFALRTVTERIAFEIDVPAYIRHKDVSAAGGAPPSNDRSGFSVSALTLNLVVSSNDLPAAAPTP